ncbi:hypothetical protein SAMN02745166_01516 [Prosthecobacter debontii]|uniref:Pyocin activator protein PrtN n=1 Tax=Prosthecobacter debontii TaxID=48467 RepID=A0A1T4XIQ0_9BACT|nr:hypothetical protein [Prosthecobacter debontii]SKA88971.1 hypothetical protein SAMN02745166_01516 [Prosthecobacter debontii]
MISGPLSLRLVARFLGKTEDAMPTVIKDGLPTVQVNADKGPVTKVYFTQLLDWVNKSAKTPMTAEQLEAELTRCQSTLKAQDKIKRQKAKQKVSL